MVQLIFDRRPPACEYFVRQFWSQQHMIIWYDAICQRRSDVLRYRRICGPEFGRCTLCSDGVCAKLCVCDVFDRVNDVCPFKKKCWFKRRSRRISMDGSRISMNNYFISEYYNLIKSKNNMIKIAWKWISRAIFMFDINDWPNCLQRLHDILLRFGN